MSTVYILLNFFFQKWERKTEMGDSLICMGMLTELMRYIHTLILILMNMCIKCKDVFKFINRDCSQITMLFSLMQPALFVYKYIHSNPLFNSHNRVHSSNKIVCFDQCKHTVYAWLNNYADQLIYKCISGCPHYWVPNFWALLQ